MFKFEAIPESKHPRTREFSDAMRQGAVLHFTKFINSFQKRIGSSKRYPALNFFRKSLSRRGLLYSIMAAHWTGEELNVSAECSSKAIDYSNAQKTIREAQAAGFLDEEMRPTKQLEDEFHAGVMAVLTDINLLHLARSIVGSNMLARMTEQLAEADRKSGKKP
jgi:hypothetical protein|tara:strand:+ start:15408 stop:15899 length:492 start_codon:yes stop_codon:yes gene_type:complete